MPDFPDVIRSPLTQDFSDGEITVRVEIYKREGVDGWRLEVVDENGASTIWQNVFATDTAAMAEFTEAVELLGLAGVITPDEGDAAMVH